jgi:hypothetical protein
LAELLVGRLGALGFVVAHLEMGSSANRAEDPRQVVVAVEQQAEAMEGRLRVRGRQQLTLMGWARRLPPQEWLHRLVQPVHDRLPGSDAVHARYHELARLGADGSDPLSSQHVLRSLCSAALRLPQQMSAVNLAVAELSRFAYELERSGFKGLVILLDEAERSEWAMTYYRTDRARDLMVGLSLAAVNRSTRSLKHYRDDRSKPYVPDPPSRLHVIHFFTRPWGLCRDLEQLSGARPLALASLGVDAREEVIRRIDALYRVSHQLDGRRLPSAPDEIREQEDVRELVRSRASQLDYWYYHGRN